MTNEQLSKTFELIADLLEIKGEVIYKTLAYRKAAESLWLMAEDVNKMQAEKRLMEIPGVGKAISEKIDELLTTGKLEFLEKLEEEVPVTVVEMLAVPDVGPKKAARFWKELGITSLADLEMACRIHRVQRLPGMGEKSEERLLAGIEALSRRSNRQALGTILPVAQRWLSWLKKQPGILQADIAGSVRRGKNLIGDLDLVAACREPAAVMSAFAEHTDVVRVLGQGENKASVETNNGLNIQLWIQPPERYGTLLQFVTGSKDHNVALREFAQKKKLSLSEKAILRENGEEILCGTEEDVYRELGLPYIVPELREDRGEIAAAAAGKLPRLIEIKDLVSDLHTHSTWSDGAGTIEEMAVEAMRRGLRIYAVTDHSGGLGIAGGLTVEKLREQRKEIAKVQEKLGSGILLLQGSEIEIRADGSLDFADEVLAELDIVVASLHVSLRQPREQVTARLLNAIRNPHVDIIGHPTGRLLPNRDGADLDMEAILQAAAETGTCLEINANPYRLDLDEIYARRAAEMGIAISIDTDAHLVSQLDQITFGIQSAQRAWLRPQDVINTLEPAELLKWLKTHKKM